MCFGPAATMKRDIVTPTRSGTMNALDSQTIAYEFSADVFDGSTLAPLPEPAGDDPAQLFRASAENIGIFPINAPDDALASTSRGNRWLTWFEISLNNPAPAGSAIRLVDNSGTSAPVVLLEIADYSGQTVLYRQTGLLVPQGAALAVEGGSGRFRYHVTFLDPQGLALLASLVLTTQQGANGGDGQSCCLSFAPEILDNAGVFALSVDVIAPYDASTLADNALVMQLPAEPAANARVAIKEVGNSPVLVTLDGNGASVEGPGTLPMATTEVGLPRVALTFQFDAPNNTWRLV